MTILRTSVSFAAAAAVVAITASAPTIAIAKGSSVVHCYGVNSCKGMNDCKGQGFKAISAKACKSQHGSTTAPN